MLIRMPDKKQELEWFVKSLCKVILLFDRYSICSQFSSSHLLTGLEVQAMSFFIPQISVPVWLAATRLH
jgi:hypothetical protein